MSNEVQILFNAGDGGKWERTLTADELAQYVHDRPDVIKDHGLDACREIVFPIGVKPKRLWFHAVTYVHGARSWTEWRIANDSMEDAIGYLRGQLAVLVKGRPVITTRNLVDAGDAVELWDQTSFSGVIGKPFWAPDKTKLSRYMATWEPTDGTDLDLASDDILHAIRQWWSKPDPRGEDHFPLWNETHQTGSPGAEYDDENYLAYLAFPDEHGPAAVLLRWTYEHLGTSYIGENNVPRFHPGRPFHLYAYGLANARPFSRLIDDEGRDPTFFGEGPVELKRSSSWPIGVGVNTWGRIWLPMIDAREKPEWKDWIGARVFGNSSWSPGRVTARGRNGGDAEHMYRQIRLAAGALLTPSVFSANTLRCLAEGWTLPTLDQWGVPVKGWPHSDRTAGWMLNLYVWSGFVLDDDRYVWISRAMRDALINRTENGLIPEWIAEHVRDGAPYMISRERQRSFWDAAWSTSACWQTATIANAALLGADVDVPEQRERWMELAKQAIAVSDACVVYGDDGKAIGLAENIKVFRDGHIEQDPGPPPGISWDSTRHWCPGPASAFGLPWTEDAHTYYRSRTGNTEYQDDNERTWRWQRRQRVLWGRE
jgi:hypothetical protein